MNALLHHAAQWVRAHVTQPRLWAFLALFLVAQLGIFLYLQSQSGMLDRSGRVRGKDFFIIYLASYLVHRGEASRLYDQEYFLKVEAEFVTYSDLVPRNPSVYPPNAAVFFEPLGALPYDQAVIAWWVMQLFCFVVAGVLLYRDYPPAPAWKWTAILGYAAFYPLLATFQHGQFAAILMLSLTAGLSLHRRNLPWLAGIVWSCFALKPQLALGFGAWLLFRLDWRSLLGLLVGGLVQLAITVHYIGWEPFVAYLHNFALIGQWTKLFTFAADHQHAFTGSLSPWLPETWRTLALYLHAVLSLLAAWWFWRLVRRQAEYSVQVAAMVVFTLFVVPHLLTYDLVYLLIPVSALLRREQADNVDYLISAALLYTAALLAPLYAFLGFSLMPLAMLAALWLVTRPRPSPPTNGP